MISVLLLPVEGNSKDTGPCMIVSNAVTKRFKITYLSSTDLMQICLFLLLIYIHLLSLFKLNFVIRLYAFPKIR